MEKVLRLYRFAYLYGITGQRQMQYVCGRISQAALYKEPGSRLAAVVAVAQGLFPAGLFGGSMLFESTLAVPFARQIKQKLRYPLDTGVLGGAKQPKSEPLPSGASLAAISSKVMVFVPSL